MQGSMFVKVSESWQTSDLMKVGKKLQGLPRNIQR